MTYDCSERKSIEIKSLKQFDEMKKFFSMQIKQKVFKEVDVDEPYYVWKNKSNNSVMYYADK